MTGSDWLTIGEAAKRAGCSPRTMRRRLKRLHRLSDGRLLRPNNDAGVVRKWWISRAVLEEILTKKRAERQGVKNVREELDRISGNTKDAHDRIDELALRADAQKRLLQKHRRHIDKLDVRANKVDARIEALKRAVSAVNEAAAAIIEVS